MAKSFKELLKNSNKSLQQLTEELEKMKSQGVKGPDERFWYPKLDKSGNGFAVIRFLPPPKNEDAHLVRLFTRGFQGPSGSWYVENDLSTIGQTDPVGEYCKKLYNSGIESDKKKASQMKRKLQYNSNIYVVRDPADADREGKVYLYRYGAQIMEKINGVTFPSEEEKAAGVKPLDPFNLMDGVNLNLKIRSREVTLDNGKKVLMPNYESSNFDNSPNALLNGDAKALEAIWEKEYGLQALIASDQFKSYNELKTKFFSVMGFNSAEPATPAATAKGSTPPWENDPEEVEPEDDQVKYFEDLANS